jgi:uncharacterized protein (DUF952 family)
MVVVKFYLCRPCLASAHSAQNRKNMGWYQAFMGDGLPSKIYHLCPKSDWENRPSKGTYKSADFIKDRGIVRATHVVERLLETADCFYQSTSPANVEWVCLQIDTMGLGMQGVECKLVESTVDSTQKCPHIFGAVPTEAVTRIYPVQRDTDTGKFLAVVGLTDVSCGCPSKSNNGVAVSDDDLKLSV